MRTPPSSKLHWTRAQVDIRGRRGSTPLHLAAYSNGNRAILVVLLDAGADVNARDEFDPTPLHDAARNGNRPAIIALLEADADPNARDKLGMTPWDHAKSRETYNDSDAYRRLREAGR